MCYVSSEKKDVNLELQESQSEIWDYILQFWVYILKF